MHQQQNTSLVIIIGAARSGTKLLRSLIAATGHFASVPFDINYIWRYGNEHWSHDALPSESAQSNRVRSFIGKQLRQLAGVSDTSRPIVEKTVSNILRLPFVHAMFPNAKYVVLVRDGRDVTESAIRCWQSPPQAGYLFAKARTFPWRNCGRYAAKYAATFARRRLGLDEHLKTWGPRYPGIDIDVAELSLAEVCARQWVASMDHYERSKSLLDTSQVVELRYEDLVRSPGTAIQLLCSFLGVADATSALNFARANIRTDRIASRRAMNPIDAQRVLQIVEPTLARWGYATKLFSWAA